MKKISTFIVALTLFILPNYSSAGGWDNKKGLDQVTVEAELVCLGCSLKKLSGANAQCGLYTLHDVGVKLGDGTLWSIVNNAIGHDIIRGHGLLEHKTATVTGWLYPNANHIEIAKIDVHGVTPQQIAQAAWEEDQKVAKVLASRKVGDAPAHQGHAHGHDSH